jgi:primase-polymerase (primpol)-like protein
MHAYHYTKVQHLLPEDYAPRVEFCTWLLEQHAENPNTRFRANGGHFQHLL